MGVWPSKEGFAVPPAPTPIRLSLALGQWFKDKSFLLAPGGCFCSRVPGLQETHPLLWGSSRQVKVGGKGEGWVRPPALWLCPGEALP